ncbi:MAG: flagellar hook-length control protein FliK [Geminicoccaceae bacterium]
MPQPVAEVPSPSAQPAAAVQPGPHAGAAAPAHALPPVAGLRVVARRIEGSSRLSLELRPAHLGAVEVALKVDDQGALTASFLVERPDTLDLLQRDSRALVSALADAGFRLDSGGLEFQLRDHEQAPQRQPQQQQEPAAGREPVAGVPHCQAVAATGTRGLYDLRV